MSDSDLRALLVERTEALLAAHPPASTDQTTFFGAQFDAGLAWVHFPEGLGGVGAPMPMQSIVDERLGAAGAPNGRMINTTAYGQGAATILAFGSDDQKQRYLRRIFTCEDIWCQLFSEPGSGSDLAGLSTRAVRDGDEWIVTGQKVWTTRGHIADYGLLLARSDPDVPKHEGLTYFVLNMRQPGVVVRPLRQMTGDATFNEIFIDEARVPDSERLGEVGEGWTVSRTTLLSERQGIAGGMARGGPTEPPVITAWRRRADKASPSALALRDRVVQAFIDGEVMRFNRLRSADLRSAGKPAAHGSMGKLQGSVTGRATASLAVDLIGADGMLFGSYDPTAPRDADRALQAALVGSPSGGLAGGTDNIQRNIIGEQVLGLPREPDPTRGQPWSQTLHN